MVPKFYPPSLTTCHHQVCSTLVTSVRFKSAGLLYQQALSTGMKPANVEYESPSTANVGFTWAIVGNATQANNKNNSLKFFTTNYINEFL